MPLEWQRQTIPMLGVDESTDERMMTLDKLRECRNGTVVQGKAIAKRNGFRETARAVKHIVTADGVNVDKARGLFSTGTELCILSGSRLLGFSEARSCWQDRGPISPCVAKAETMFRDATDHSQADMDRLGDFAMYVARRRVRYREQTFGPLDEKWGIEIQVRTVNGQLVFAQAAGAYNDESSSQSSMPHSPRVCHAVGSGGAAPKLIGLWGVGADGTASILRRYTYDTRTHTGTVASNVTTDLFECAMQGGQLGGYTGRRFDGIGLDRVTQQGRYVVAWVSHADRTTTIKVYTTDGTEAAAATIGDAATERHYLVSLCESSSSDHVWVMVAIDGGGGADSLKLYKLSSDTLATSTTLLLDVLSAGKTKDRFFNISMGAGSVTGAVGETPNRLAILGCSWGVAEYNPSEVVPARIKVVSRPVRESDATAIQTEADFYNAIPVSRPWFHDSRCYQWLQTAVCQQDPEHDDVALDGTAPTIAFEAHWMADLMMGQANPESGGRIPNMVGLHSVGTAPPFLEPTENDLQDRPLPLIWANGNCANVVRWPDSDEYRHAVPVICNAEETQDPRHEILELSCDFAAPVSVAITSRGAAVIGGALTTWYAGGFTEEVGYVVPPMIVVSSGNYPIGFTMPAFPAPPTTLPVEDYTWQAIWESYDNLGHYHRSHPSPPVMHQHRAPYDSVKHAFWCSSATNRYLVPGREMSVVLYRAATDAQFARATRVMRLVANEPASQHWTDEVIDYGEFIDDNGVGVGSLLYTNGGIELENVAPEGAAFPAVCGELVWLAGMVRGERLQHSKPRMDLAVEGGPVAPEFNEGLGLSIPSGEPATAVVGDEDKVAIFTEGHVYVIAGTGPDAAGNNSDFSQLTPVHCDGGCVEARSVVSTPLGVFFQHRAGIYLLQGMGTQFVGYPVSGLTETYPVITSAVLVPGATQVRFTCNNAAGTAGIVLVYDYQGQAWMHWVIKPHGQQIAFAGACMHDGVYHVVTPTGVVYREDETTHRDEGLTWVPLAVKTAWAQGAGSAGWQRMRKAIPLIKSEETHGIAVTVYRDFSETSDQAEAWSGTEVAAFAQPEQVCVRLANQQGQAYAFEVEDTDPGVTLAPTGEGYSIAGITLEYGVKRGVAKVPREQRA